MKKSIALVLLFFFTFSLKAQFAISPTVKEAFENIMVLRLNEAELLIEKELKSNPKNGFIPYLKSNLIFLKLFLSDDRSKFEVQLERLEELIEEVKDNKADTSLYYNYCLAEMNFELGALYMQMGSTWNSAWTMLEAFNRIQSNSKAPSTFLPQQMTEGILNVTMGSLPNRYKVLARLLGYTGDVQKGIDLLESSTHTERTPYDMFKKKCAFAYCYTLSSLNENDSINLWDVDSNYMNSPLLVYLQAKLYKNRGQNDELIELLQKYDRTSRFPFYYLDLMLGTAKLNRMDTDANIPLERFLKNYPGSNSVKAANRNLYWHYHLIGKDKLAENFKQKVIDSGDDKIGADKMALFDIEQVYNPRLVRAHLYYDGGYLKQALKELDFNEEMLPSRELKMEYFYRFGRIYQRQNDYESAIRSYKRVFEYHGATNAYYVANASLQLGILYEEILKDYKEARLFYNKALNYTDFPFEDGIHQKAKTGLERIKKVEKKM